MLHKLPRSLRAVFVASGMIINTIFWCTLLFGLTFFKILTPSRAGRAALGNVGAEMAQRWIGMNNRFMAWGHPMRWEVTGLEGLEPDDWYLVVSNHVSGLDIPVIQRVFHRRIPFIRFFLKRELIFVPLLGAAWWALDFPFMSRHSREAIAKDPSLRSADQKSAERTFARTGHYPTAILTFAEGTRFTQQKHDAQNSPYRYLLNPKSGGLAYAVAAMGDRFRALLDVTIVYPEGEATLWDMVGGKVGLIRVHVEQRQIPADLLTGDYQNDEAYRDRFKAWLHELWQEKDARIAQMREEYSVAQP